MVGERATGPQWNLRRRGRDYDGGGKKFLRTAAVQGFGHTHTHYIHSLACAWESIYTAAVRPVMLLTGSVVYIAAREFSLSLRVLASLLVFSLFLAQ